MWSGSRGISLIAAALGIMMIAAGASKLAGESHQVMNFAKWGLPHWFMMLVGTFEVIGGALLAFPPASPAGSLILSTIMVGAIWTHVAHAQWLSLIPPAALLAMFLFVFRSRYAEAMRLISAGRPRHSP